MEFLPLIVLSGLQVGCIYAMMALSYFVIINATGILNFAQGEWMMLSAVFGAALIANSLPYPLAVLGSIAAATTVSLLAERLVIRPLQARNADINILVVALLGILVVVRYTTGLIFGREEVRLEGPLPQAPIILGDSLFILPQTLFVFAATATVFIGLWLFLHRTTFGRSFRIAAIDPLGAQIVGVDLGKVRFAAFAIGGLIAAILAWLYGPLYAAGYLMGEAPGVKGFIALIIGGLISPLGALTGGLLLGLFEVATAYYIGSLYSEGIAFVMLMLFLFVPTPRFGGIALEAGVSAPLTASTLLGRSGWTWLRILQWSLIAVLLALLPMVITNGYYLTLATNVAVTMILTLSLNFTIGRIGLFSLAHSAFLGIGAYLAAILAQRHGLSPWLTLPVAIIGSGTAAAVIGIPVLRLRGMFLSVATLAFGLFAEVLARQASDVTGGAYGITGIPPLMLFGIPLRGTAMYEVALVVLLLTALILENIRLSRFGRAIVASRDNEAAAAAAGIDIARTRLAGFVLSAAFAASAGWVYSFFHLTLNPYVLSLDITFVWLFIVLVGGLGSMRGVAVATVLLGIGPELLGFASTQQVLISGILVLVVVLLAPRGIGGLIEDLEQRSRGTVRG